MGKSETENWPVVGVRLPPATAEALNRRAAAMGITRSALVRRSLDLMLDVPTLAAHLAVALAATDGTVTE